MENLKLLVPRPVRDTYSSWRSSAITDEKQFAAVTIGRLLLAGLGGVALRCAPVPKWAVYGAMAPLSLPATMAFAAGELAYRGVSSFSSNIRQIGISTALVGSSLLLFENYDRLNLHSEGSIHLVPEEFYDFNGGRYTTWQRQSQLIGEATWGSRQMWGNGLLEPALASGAAKLFPKETLFKI